MAEMIIELIPNTEHGLGFGESFTGPLMRRRRRKKEEKIEEEKFMDWDWWNFAWDETETETELIAERIGDSLSVGSEKKINIGEIMVGNGGNNSEERLTKMARPPKRANNLTCLVDGCEEDLGNCKEYHRRHRVCRRHSKIAVVVVSGEEKRFCQQCSRFHSLGEFDAAKRSCRKRLEGHNRRRRKPRPESLYLTSKDFLSNFKGPRILQFSSPLPNLQNMDGRITEAEAMDNNGADEQFSLKQKNIQKHGDQSNPQISNCHPLPVAAEIGRGGHGHGMTQPIDPGCALYLLSSLGKQAPRGCHGSSFEAQFSPSLPNSWE